MGDLSDLVRGNSVRHAPDTGSGSYTDRVGTPDDELDGKPTDAFRMATGNRQAHTLDIEMPDIIHGIPYPLISGYDIERKTGYLVLDTPRFDFTVEGEGLRELHKAIGDYKIREIRPGNRDKVKITKIVRSKEKRSEY